MADVEEPSGPDPPDPPGDAEAAAFPAVGAADLEALDVDAWATLLAVAKQVAADAEEGVAPGLDLVRTTASARLVGRRARVRAATLLSAPVSWGPIAAALAARGPLPAALAALVHPTPQGDDARSDATPVTSEATGDDGTRPDPASRTPATADPALRDRLRATRLDRDEWRRRAQGADARTDQLRADLELARRTLAERDERIAALEDELAQAGAALERDRARERRRAAGDRAALEQDLREARRLLEDERREHRRALARATERAGAGPRTAPGTDHATSTVSTPTDDRFVVGRPSRLPAEVVAGTTEAARLLLHRGRRVLVDGYNVTKQHQGSLTLEGQRAWLVRLLATLVARRGVAPTIVFDGQVSSGGRPPMGAREVAVVFTPAGITADDEIVLAVDATDEPIVVVSDDRELVARVRALGADVLDTRSFLGAAS